MRLVVLVGLVVALTSCQKGEDSGTAAAPPPLTGAAAADAFNRDVARICDVMRLSGADKDPGSAPVTTAKWLAANIESETGKQFMIALNGKSNADKVTTLVAAATGAGLPSCALAELWKTQPGGH